MDSNRNSLNKLSQVVDNASAEGKTEIQNSLECGSQIEYLTNDYYPFKVLTKHDLSLDVIFKNRFKLEDHSFNQLSTYITRDKFWPSDMI